MKILGLTHLVSLNSAACLLLEVAYVYMAKHLYKKTGIRNFCLTGGVSLNCLANSKILELDFVDKLFIQPVSNDAGTALGAVLLKYIEVSRKKADIKFDNIYWGPEFNNDQVSSAIKKAQLPYCKRSSHIEKLAAKLLAKGKIIG